MRLVYFFSLSILLVSCKQPKVEEVRMSELIDGEGKMDADSTQSERITVNYIDSLSPNVRLILDTLGLINQKIDPLDTLFFADRFKKKSGEKWQLDSVTFFAIYQYKDSIDARNAFYNSIDCFGPKCNSLLQFEEKKLSKFPFILLLTENQMIYFENQPFTISKELLANVETSLGKARVLYVVEQAAGRKTRWWIKKNEEWVVNKPNDTK